MANEAAMARRKAQSALDAAIYGAAGSSLVESVADACEAAVVADAAKWGMRTNWRYSPGYGDLPLALQPEIVRVLAADKRLGMVATESNLLIPTKSVTAFVGLFDADANFDEISGEGKLRRLRLSAELHAARRWHAFAGSDSVQGSFLCLPLWPPRRREPLSNGLCVEPCEKWQHCS